MSDGLITSLRTQGYNNAWSNHRLLTACGQLSAASLNAERTSFFPTIMRTLNHILIVDWFYVSALEGRGMGVSAFADEVPCPEFADLDREQRAIDRRLIDFCDALTPDLVSATAELQRADRVQIERVDRILLHLFEHQIHHRGQVHAMLAGTEVAPPQLDEFFMAEERALRAADFEALGFVEEEIWR